jgi:predicted ester cyclase
MNHRHLLLWLAVLTVTGLVGCDRQDRQAVTTTGGTGSSMAQNPDIKRAARRFYETVNEAMRTGNTGLLDQVIAGNAVDHNPVPGQSPGRDGIKRAFAEFRTAFPDMRTTVEDMVAEGDKVACRVTVRMTHRGTFQKVKPTGKQVTLSGIDILRFVDGNLVERWGEFDTFGLLQQLGARPAATPIP